MKQIQILELLKQIPDHNLFESAYKGFMMIFENENTELKDDIATMTYDAAADDLDILINDITNSDELGKIIEDMYMTLFHGYREYNNIIKDGINQINDKAYITFYQEIFKLAHEFDGDNSYQEYKDKLSNIDIIQQNLNMSDIELTNFLNNFVIAEKFNALLHKKIKAEYMPKYQELKKAS